MLSLSIDLREVVEEDQERGRSVIELVQNFDPCFMVAATLRHDQAYTVIHSFHPIYVKDTPFELLTKIQAEIEKEWRSLGSIIDSVENGPDFRVYDDMEKSILINMDLVKTIRPITKFQTKFEFKGKAGNIIIRLPLEWLDVPKNKIKKETKNG